MLVDTFGYAHVVQSFSQNLAEVNRGGMIAIYSFSELESVPRCAVGRCASELNFRGCGSVCQFIQLSRNAKLSFMQSEYVCAWCVVDAIGLFDNNRPRSTK